MEEKKFENDIRLKKSIMGFDKKSVMDFIEDLGLQNEELKQEIALLQDENAKLRQTVEDFQSFGYELPEDYEQPAAYEETTHVTYEDLSIKPQELDSADDEHRAEIAKAMKAAYIEIQQEHTDAQLVAEDSFVSVDESVYAQHITADPYGLDGYTGEYPDFDAYPTSNKEPAKKPKKVKAKVRVSVK